MHFLSDRCGLRCLDCARRCSPSIRCLASPQRRDLRVPGACPGHHLASTGIREDEAADELRGCHDLQELGAQHDLDDVHHPGRHLCHRDGGVGSANQLLLGFLHFLDDRPDLAFVADALPLSLSRGKKLR